MAKRPCSILLYFFSRLVPKTKLDPLTECWEWIGARDRWGYGVTTFCNLHRRPHRLSYEATIGTIPEGLTLDHLCQNRACINPAHLEAVTSTENIRRGFGICVKNSQKTHCKYGHPLTPDNVRPDLKRRGRCCKTCSRAKYRQWYWRDPDKGRARTREGQRKKRASPALEVLPRQYRRQPQD